MSAIAFNPLAGKNVTTAKNRKTSNRRRTSEDITYVLNNYATTNTSEIAQHLGLTKQQVSHVIMDTRKRLEEKMKTATPEERVKIENFLNKNLPRKPFGGGRSGARKNQIDVVLEDIL